MTFSRLIGTSTATVLSFGLAASASAQAPKTLPAAQGPAPARSFPSLRRPADVLPAGDASKHPAVGAPVAPSKTYAGRQCVPSRPAQAPSKSYPVVGGPVTTGQAPSKSYPAVGCPGRHRPGAEQVLSGRRWPVTTGQAPSKSYPAVRPSCPGCHVGQADAPRRASLTRPSAAPVATGQAPSKSYPAVSSQVSRNSFKGDPGRRCLRKSRRRRSPHPHPQTVAAPRQWPRAPPAPAAAPPTEEAPPAPPVPGHRRKEDLILAQSILVRIKKTPATSRPGSFCWHCPPGQHASSPK